MPSNFGALLNGPAYSLLGTAITITPLVGDAFSLTAIDKTSGVEVMSTQGSATVPSVRPAADVQMADVTAAGFTRRTIIKATFAMNGKTWRVDAALPKPTPAGEADGELRLILSEIA
jgi:hypothetical protein